MTWSIRTAGIVPAFRPGTSDLDIWSAVNYLNEYQLPSSFSNQDVIIDVGGHIGAFGHAVLVRGAGRLFAFEACDANFKLMRRNLNRFRGRTSLQAKAVWRSDQATPWIRFVSNPSDRGANTGGGNVIYNAGQEIPALPFDEIIWSASEEGRKRIRLAKIDCEGSEWPILFTSKKLDLVQTICGEYHELSEIPELARVEGFARYNVATLVEYLEKLGFAIRIEATVPGVIGLFWAERK